MQINLCMIDLMQKKAKMSKKKRREQRKIFAIKTKSIL